MFCIKCGSEAQRGEKLCGFCAGKQMTEPAGVASDSSGLKARGDATTRNASTDMTTSSEDVTSNGVTTHRTRASSCSTKTGRSPPTIF